MAKQEFLEPQLPSPPRFQAPEIVRWMSDLVKELDRGFREIKQFMMPYTGVANVSTQVLASGDSINADGLIVLISAAGAISTDATTPIAAGEHGARLIIVNIGANAITVKDATTCSLGGDVVLGTEDSLMVVWWEDRWIRLANANN